MASAGYRHLALFLLGTLVLAGCEAGTNPFKSLGASDTAADPAANSATNAGAPAGAVARASGADVEAPEVFQTTAKGLWDGRPSLGGVWVATADAKDPERVLIRNAANGRSVIGALFRRERENPGPPIQISSDAAEALGLLAGQPAEVSITALRREEPAQAAAEAAPATPEAVAATPLDTEAVSAAIDKSEAKRPAMAAETVEAAPKAAPAPAPAATGTGGGALIQIGIFSVEANANQAAATVTKAGAPATVRKENSKGKTYWSVVAGPAESAADREALMTKVKGLGFADAYFVSR